MSPQLGSGHGGKVRFHADERLLDAGREQQDGRLRAATEDDADTGRSEATTCGRADVEVGVGVDRVRCHEVRRHHAAVAVDQRDLRVGALAALVDRATAAATSQLLGGDGEAVGHTDGQTREGRVSREHLGGQTELACAGGACEIV